jgi:hypothetical protein
VLIGVILAIFGIVYLKGWYMAYLQDLFPPYIIGVIGIFVVIILLVRYVRRGPRSAGPVEGGCFRLLKLSMRLITRAVEDGLKDREIHYRMGIVHEHGDVAMRLFRFEEEEVRLALYVHEPTMTSVVFVTPDSSTHGPLVAHIKESVETTVPLL